METLRALVEAHGYALLFAVGTAEFAGLPIAGVPLIVIAGSYVADGTLSLPGAVLSPATGGLLADALWYGLARRHRAFVARMACGLASEPGACVLGVQNRAARLGARFLVVAKLVPGVANLSAPAAGLARLSLWRFLLGDGAGLVLWAGIATGIGWIAADQVEAALRWLSAYAKTVLAIAAGLVATGLGIRWLKLRRHRALHGARARSAP